MRYGWQLLVVMALALTALGFASNSAVGQTTTTAISTTTTTTTPPPTTTGPTPTTTTNPAGGQGQPGGGQMYHEVGQGESLWTIARDQLEAAAGGAGEPTTDEVTAYWNKLKAVNQPRLASGDPDVIELGEKVLLPPVPSAGARPAPETPRRTTYQVARGDSLWTIARHHLAAVGSGSGEPTLREVAAYWLTVVEANRHRLASGDPDLIYPGEQILLPPVH